MTTARCSQTWPTPRQTAYTKGLAIGRFATTCITGSGRNKYFVSHETIYKFIYKCKREWIRLLARGHRKRYKRTGIYKNRRKVNIPNRISIDERPKYIDKRKMFGHYEADLMVTRSSKEGILVLVERKTRLVNIVKLLI